MSRKLRFGSALVIGILGIACGSGEDQGQSGGPMSEVEAKLAQYTTVRLTTDVSVLSEAERAMIPS